MIAYTRVTAPTAIEKTGLSSPLALPAAEPHGVPASAHPAAKPYGVPASAHPAAAAGASPVHSPAVSAPASEVPARPLKVASLEPASAPSRQPGKPASAPASPHTASAQSSSSAHTAGGAARWHGKLLGRLERFRRYPEEARKQRQEGMVRLRFALNRQGRVVFSRIESSSGVSTLDEEALALLRRADPLPAPPPDVKGERIELVVPVRFFLRDASPR